MAITRLDADSAPICSSQLGQHPDRPWMKTIGGPDPISTVFTALPATSTHR